MQHREPSTFEIWSGNVVDRHRSQPQARLRNLLTSDRDAVLVVREPFGDRARATVLVTAALVASFALGWAGGLNWPHFANELRLIAMALQQAPAPHIVEARSTGKVDAARKTASAADPAIVGSIPKPPVLLPAARPASHASAATSSVVAMQQPQLAVPETKPATIPGWTVVDVRDGTAVLEGPDGIRMAARGDSIPGVGRVESIVRWGNRWVVATANGLIATP